MTGSPDFQNASGQNVSGGIEAGGNITLNSGGIINGPVYVGGNLQEALPSMGMYQLLDKI